MGFKRDDLPSSGGDFLKARDLPPNWKEDYTIAEVGMQTFPARDNQGEQQKLILTFRETEKTLPLNQTNMELLFENVDGDTDNWIGATVRLFIGSTKFGPGIKLQVFAQSSAPDGLTPRTRDEGAPYPTPAATEVAGEEGAGDVDFDDDIPF